MPAMDAASRGRPVPDPDTGQQGFRGFGCPVRSEWLDYNRHVNDAAYAVVFTLANESVIDALGLGAGYAAATGRALFTVEAHLWYRQVVAADGRFAAVTLVAAADDKRLRLRTRLYDVAEGGAGWAVADGEHLYLHVDRDAGRVVPFGAAAAQRLAALWAAHRDLTLPERES